MAKTVQPSITSTKQHVFDRKYKTVVSVKSTWSYLEMIDWVNKNSYGSVDVWFNDTPNGVIIDIAFENSNDALVFKIKYST